MSLPSTVADDRFPIVEIVLFWLAVAIMLAVTNWANLDDSFISTDNSMRLVEVRNLLDGAPWFDPHESRFNPPLGYDTHWSRLIDGGIAGLIMLFRHFVSFDLAERLARCIWPLLLSGPTVAAVVMIAVRLGGEGAGRAALLAALPTVALLPTFHLGEIDHHNAQIMLSLVMLACAIWCNRSYCAVAAGIAGGMLLSVGLEATHVAIAVAATFGLLVVHDPAWSKPAGNFAVALGLSTLGGFLAVTPADFRLTAQCDALAINSTAAVAIGAAGLTIVAAFADRWPRPGRLLALAAAGLLASAVYVWFEPRCLRGPFGLTDSAIFRLWLNSVEEMRPLSRVVETEGWQSVVYLAFPVVSVLSIMATVRDGLRTPVAWALIAAFVISGLIMIGQIRMLIYVDWLGLPFVGVAAQLLGQRTSRATLVRLLAALLASPAVISTAAAHLTPSGTGNSERAASGEKVLACFRPGNFRTLAGLPPGLVLAPLDLGPSVLAQTRHSVVAAPYHRADRAIAFNQETMEGPSAEARDRVLARGVVYVVTCTGYLGQTAPGSFHDALLAGTPGPWLERVPTRPEDVIRIWRVVR